MSKSGAQVQWADPGTPDGNPTPVVTDNANQQRLAAFNRSEIVRSGLRAQRSFKRSNKKPMLSRCPSLQPARNNRQPKVDRSPLVRALKPTNSKKQLKKQTHFEPIAQPARNLSLTQQNSKRLSGKQKHSLPANGCSHPAITTDQQSEAQIHEPENIVDVLNSYTLSKASFKKSATTSCEEAKLFKTYMGLSPHLQKRFLASKCESWAGDQRNRELPWQTSCQEEHTMLCVEHDDVNNTIGTAQNNDQQQLCAKTLQRAQTLQNTKKRQQSEPQQTTDTCEHQNTIQVCEINRHTEIIDAHEGKATASRPRSQGDTIDQANKNSDCTLQRTQCSLGRTDPILGSIMVPDEENSTHVSGTNASGRVSSVGAGGYELDSERTMMMAINPKDNKGITKLKQIEKQVECELDGLVPKSVTSGVKVKLYIKVVNASQLTQPVTVSDFDNAIRSGPGNAELVMQAISKSLFQLEFTLLISGTYIIALSCQKVPVKGAPVCIEAMSGKTSYKHCVCRGPGLQTAMAGKECVFNIIARDQLQNQRRRGGDKFLVEFTGPQPMEKTQVQDLSDGRYRVTYVACQSAWYAITIYLGPNKLPCSPFYLWVRPGHACAQHTLVTHWPRCAHTHAGTPATFKVQMRDKYYNVIREGGGKLLAYARKRLDQDAGDGTGVQDSGMPEQQQMYTAVQRAVAWGSIVDSDVLSKLKEMSMCQQAQLISAKAIEGSAVGVGWASARTTLKVNQAKSSMEPSFQVSTIDKEASPKLTTSMRPATSPSVFQGGGFMRAAGSRQRPNLLSQVQMMANTNYMSRTNLFLQSLAMSRLQPALQRGAWSGVPEPQLAPGVRKKLTGHPITCSVQDLKNGQFKVSGCFVRAGKYDVSIRHASAIRTAPSPDANVRISVTAAQADALASNAKLPIVAGMDVMFTRAGSWISIPLVLRDKFGNLCSNKTDRIETLATPQGECESVFGTQQIKPYSQMQASPNRSVILCIGALGEVSSPFTNTKRNTLRLQGTPGHTRRQSNVQNQHSKQASGSGTERMAGQTKRGDSVGVDKVGTDTNSMGGTAMHMSGGVESGRSAKRHTMRFMLTKGPETGMLDKFRGAENQGAGQEDTPSDDEVAHVVRQIATALKWNRSDKVSMLKDRGSCVKAWAAMEQVVARRGGPAGSGAVLQWRCSVAGKYAMDVYVNGVKMVCENIVIRVNPSDIAPEQCTAHGDALTQAHTDCLSSFTIVTRDQYDNRLTRGGEAITAVIVPGGATDITDNGDGTYTASYTCSVVGRYSVHIMHAGEHHIRGSPFKLNIVPQRCVGDLLSIQGKAYRAGVAGHVCSFRVIRNDEDGQALLVGGDTLSLVYDMLPGTDSVAMRQERDVWCVVGPTVIEDLMQQHQAQLEQAKPEDEGVEERNVGGGDGIAQLRAECKEFACQFEQELAELVMSKVDWSNQRAQPGYEWALSTDLEACRPNQTYIQSKWTGQIAMEGEGEAPNHTPRCSTGLPCVDVTATDLDNGTYRMDYTACVAGTYIPHLTHNGIPVALPVEDQLIVSPGDVDVSACMVYGPGRYFAVVGVRLNVYIQLADRTHNAVLVGQHKVRAVFYPAQGYSFQNDTWPDTAECRDVLGLGGIHVEGSVKCLGHGLYCISYTIFKSPACVLQLYIDDATSPNLCAQLPVYPGQTHPPNCACVASLTARQTSPALQHLVAGQPYQFYVIARDGRDNDKTYGGDVFEVVVDLVQASCVQKGNANQGQGAGYGAAQHAPHYHSSSQAVDNGDGTYTGTVMVTQAGQYRVQVVHVDRVTGARSRVVKYSVTAYPSMPSSVHCSVYGLGLLGCSNASVSSIQVQFRDKHNNCRSLKPFQHEPLGALQAKQSTAGVRDALALLSGGLSGVLDADGGFMGCDVLIGQQDVAGGLGGGGDSESVVSGTMTGGTTSAKSGIRYEPSPRISSAHVATMSTASHTLTAAFFKVSGAAKLPGGNVTIRSNQLTQNALGSDENKPSWVVEGIARDRTTRVHHSSQPCQAVVSTWEHTTRPKTAGAQAQCHSSGGLWQEASAGEDKAGGFVNSSAQLHSHDELLFKYRNTDGNGDGNGANIRPHSSPCAGTGEVQRVAESGEGGGGGVGNKGAARKKLKAAGQCVQVGKCLGKDWRTAEQGQLVRGVVNEEQDARVRLRSTHRLEVKSKIGARRGGQAWRQDEKPNQRLYKNRGSGNAGGNDKNEDQQFGQLDDSVEYVILFRPTGDGAHVMELKLNGTPLAGSPFIINVEKDTQSNNSSQPNNMSQIKVVDQLSGVPLPWRPTTAPANYSRSAYNNVQHQIQNIRQYNYSKHLLDDDEDIAALNNMHHPAHTRSSTQHESQQDSIPYNAGHKPQSHGFNLNLCTLRHDQSICQDTQNATGAAGTGCGHRGTQRSAGSGGRPMTTLTSGSRLRHTQGLTPKQELAPLLVPIQRHKQEMELEEQQGRGTRVQGQLVPGGRAQGELEGVNAKQLLSSCHRMRFGWWTGGTISLLQEQGFLPRSIEEKRIELGRRIKMHFDGHQNELIEQLDRICEQWTVGEKHGQDTSTYLRDSRQQMQQLARKGKVENLDEALSILFRPKTTKNNKFTSEYSKLYVDNNSS